MSELSKRLEKAEKLLQKGKPEAALEEYLSILDEKQGNDSTAHMAADLCISLGRNSDAVSLLNDLFDRQFSAGDNTNAALTYKKLLRIGRPSGERSLRFARTLAKSNADALKAYQAAYQAFTAKQQKMEVLTALQGIVAIEPAAEHFQKIGETASDLGDHNLASDAYLKAGELDPDPDSRSLLFGRAYKSNPENRKAALAHASALLRGGFAAGAVDVLLPLAGETDSEIRIIYSRALLRSGRAAQAVPLFWELLGKGLMQSDEIAEAIRDLAATGQEQIALDWARRLEQYEIRGGRRREFVALVKSLADAPSASTDVLEYAVEVFNLANRESDYCSSLLKLFDLYYAAGEFRKAAECLDRAAEVDAYEPGHQKRLEMLRGKIPQSQFATIAARLVLVLGNQVSLAQTPPETEEGADASLEDLVTQAQIYLRYSMPGKAAERLKRAGELFPQEVQNSTELRELFSSAGLQPPDPPQAEATGPAAEQSAQIPPSMQQGAVQQGAAEGALDQVTKIASITRNLYRQNSVNGVLSEAVNDIGRYWGVSRCLAVLCTPGKPPSVAMEHCAPGIERSDIHSIVALVGLLQPLALAHGALEISDARKTKAGLKALRKPLAGMGIDSLLAVPLLEGDTHIGLLVLAQCGKRRELIAGDTGLLKTIAEQVVLALDNVRLRRLVRDLAVTDESSRLVKRSSYLDILIAEVDRAMRQKSTVSVLLMNWQGAGESQVSATLDSVMRHLSQLIASHVRQSDLAVRYGPSTIALILGDTPEKNAVLAAEKLRKVSAVAYVPGQDQSPNLSMGVAEAVMNDLFEPQDIVTELINRADSAMSEALSAGGNTIRVAPRPLVQSAASA